MSCDSVQNLIPLYYYGELPPEEEDAVEQHVHGCAACAREVDRQRQLAAALDRRQVEPPPLLLEECRANLLGAIPTGITEVVSARHQTAAATRAAVPAKSAWALFLEAMGATLGSFGRYRQPLGALALVAVGFFAARLTLTKANAPQTNAPSDEVYATVRSVQPDNSGRVKIAYDETRRREVLGRADDQNIQRLLLAAAHEDNAAVRGDAVGLLKEKANSTDVRDALLDALAHDPNAGVRMKALDGLKSLTADPQVRSTVARALVSDDNPAIRMQAVDLLVTRRDDAMVGVLQRLVQRENNDYVRLKCEKALKDWNASIGTF